MFQVSAPVTSVVLHPNQVQLIVGDQSGATHIWDLKTDHNVQFMPETGMASMALSYYPKTSSY